jgi:hypothetical protein
MFVIPMAGESRRFRDAGYYLPKYRLPLHGQPLFDHAVNSFAAYFESHPFLFAVQATARDFVHERCRHLGIRDAIIVSLEYLTSGQAETVIRGIDDAGVTDDESLTIFNIDTFRPGYRRQNFPCDGYLEVFRGEGANWSFIAPDPLVPFRVAETTEKRPISDLCCTGLYEFRAAADFRWAYHNPSPARGEAEKKERYVAPLYNSLIAQGRDIRYGVIAPGDVIFCGTPKEYAECAALAELGRRLDARQ